MNQEIHFHKHNVRCPQRWRLSHCRKSPALTPLRATPGAALSIAGVSLLSSNIYLSDKSQRDTQFGITLNKFAFRKKGTVCNWSSTIFWYHRTSNKHWSFGCIPSISIQVWKHTKRQCYSQPLDPYHWMTSPSVRKYMSPQTLMAPCN